MARISIAPRACPTREEWLERAATMLRSNFEAVGYPLPEKIKFCIGFTSKGLHSKRIGEHWHGKGQVDGWHSIFIIPTLSDPLTILDILVHELCHAAAPANAKHGKAWSNIATAMGLTNGKGTYAKAGEELLATLDALLPLLGPLPHVRLLHASSVKKPSKEPVCRCPECGYEARVAKKYLEFGAPICPVHDEPLDIVYPEAEEP